MELPQGPLHTGIRAVFYFCREDPRLYVHKHRRWKWVGVTLNFAHPRAFWILAVTLLSIFPAILPGLWLDNVPILLAGAAVWAVLLCWYYYRQAELDLHRHAGINNNRIP